MDRHGADDVAVLCARSGIEPKNYRSFQSASVTGTAQREESAGKSAAQPFTLSDPPPATRFPPGRVETRHSTERSASLWAALDAALDGAGDPADDRLTATGAPAKLPEATLSLFPLGGGVGSTTVLATLAKIFAAAGERPLAVDSSPHSTLPFYFGARSPRSGISTFVPRDTGAEAAVHILVGETGAPEGEEADERLLRGLSDLRGDVDRVLIGTRPDASARLEELAGEASVCVLLLTPDPRCAMRIPLLKSFFEARREALGRAVSPYLLLNMFEPDQLRHVEMQDWLSRKFGARLLPPIRRGEEVSEALAEGMTVVEYAPNSEVAGDFYRLAEWLRGHSGSRAKAAAAAGGRN